MRNIISFSLVMLMVMLSHKLMAKNEKPNILWIIVEDMSPHFGYNGETLTKTPYVDQLAREGVVFNNTYVSAPVCSASRSALITGMYQTSIGAHNHRSSRGTEKIYLPKGIKTIPELFSKAGYHTSNCYFGRFGQKGIAFSHAGKTDYNFEFEKSDLYDDINWFERAKGQPFFAQVHLRGGKLRKSAKVTKDLSDANIPLIKPEQVELPPYYPDCEEFRDDWAKYLNTVQFTDLQVKQIIERLEADGDLDNTIIFFITDHGVSQARGKQFLYDEGAKVPFIVWSPKYFKSEEKEDLVSHIDMAASSLHLAGIEIPNYMQAKALFAKSYEPRKYVVSARDRCDETVDHIRSVRIGNFKYIKNYLYKRPYLQPCLYKDSKPFMPKLRELDEKGLLNETQQLVTAKIRPQEELYDLSNDPFEINNLADNEKYQEKLIELGNTLKAWEIESGDKGVKPESWTMYDSDMAAVIGKNEDNPKTIKLKENIALMKKWAAEGK